MLRRKRIAKLDPKRLKAERQEIFEDAIWQGLGMTQRPASEILRNLKLTKKDLRGKRVLDIGSGFSRLGHKYSKKPFNIVSLDLAFNLEAMREYSNKIGLKKAVTGNWAKLPFKRESFDLLIASYSASIYEKKLFEVINEMMRVVRKGGETRIGKLQISGNIQKRSDFLKSLEKKGWKPRFEGNTLVVSKPS